MRGVRFHGLSDPVDFNQTAFRAANRRLELQSRFSLDRAAEIFRFFAILFATWGT